MLTTLILSGVQGDTRRYRAFHLCEQFKLVNLLCSPSHVTDHRVKNVTEKAGLLILQRVAFDAIAAQIIDGARSRNAIILCDLDDLIFLRDSFQWIDSPDFADPIRARLYQENLERNRQTIEHCEGIIVSTDTLAEQVKSFDKPVWVHRNAFSLEMFACAEAARTTQPSSQNRVIIGYASGTPTHDRDFQLVRPVLQKLLEEYPSLHLHLIGHVRKGLDWGKASPRVHYLPFVPWRKLPHLLAQFSINLAPLRLDNPFSQSKSEIKYIEAALLKVPTVASPTAAFGYAIRHGENGFLANSGEEWENCLRKLIENPPLRTAMGEVAYQDVLARYSPWVRAQEAVKLLNSIIDTLRPSWSPLPEVDLPPMTNPQGTQHLWIGEEIEKHPTLFERGVYTLRTRGVTTLLQEGWIFLRRVLEPIFLFR